MAATGFTPIQLYRTTTASAVPTSGNLADGELAINLTDEKLYFKNAAGTVKLLAANITPVANGGTGLATLTANNVILGNGTSNPTFVAPGTSGNVLTSNGTTWTSAAVAASLSGVTQSVSPFETALGFEAGNVTTGVNNTWIGYRAGLLTTSGTNNTAVGFQALDANTTGGSNVALGSNALGANTTSAQNVAVGASALAANTTSGGNVAVGASALAANTGSTNTALGSSALTSNTTAADNTAVGSAALSLNTTGERNVAVGVSALTANTTASNNTAIGYQAADAVTTGSQIVAIGSGAAGSLTTANTVVAIGSSALRLATTATSSVAVGASALDVVTTGVRNTAVGNDAGNEVTTGADNIFIGASCGNITTGSNNIIIGAFASASSDTVSNEVTLGPTSITSTRLRGMVELNAAMFEAATITATAATGTINFDARTQSVLYYTSNASGNWTLNIRAASGVSLDSVMTTGESMTIAFLATQGATAYYQTGFQVDGSSVTPKWQGGTAPAAGNASSIDTYVITVIKTGSATFTVLASQTKFA